MQVHRFPRMLRDWRVDFTTTLGACSAEMVVEQVHGHE